MSNRSWINADTPSFPLKMHSPSCCMAPDYGRHEEVNLNPLLLEVNLTPFFLISISQYTAIAYMLAAHEAILF